MLRSEATELTDCISAKQLLQALNTLQQISTQSINDLQLSFSQSSHSFFNTVNNQGQMNFQLYMELKKNNKNTKKEQKHERPIKKVETNEKKDLNSFKKKPNNLFQPPIKSAVTPSKQKTPTKISQLPKQNNHGLKQLKSRSHSPLDRKSQPMNTSINSINNTSLINRKVNKCITPTKSTLSTSSVMFNTQLHDNNTKRLKENKQNVCQTQDVSAVKVLDHSKKILVDRERKGKAYVPIQDRTNQLIKQKHEKIAKMQRASQAQKQIQQRQCTFKPSINNYKKRGKDQPIPNRHRAHTTIDQLTDESTSRIDHSSIIRQFTDYAKENGESVQKFKANHTSRNQNNARGQGQAHDKDRKNGSKFNIVLDLIN